MLPSTTRLGNFSPDSRGLKMSLSTPFGITACFARGQTQRKTSASRSETSEQRETLRKYFRSKRKFTKSFFKFNPASLKERLHRRSRTSSRTPSSITSRKTGTSVMYRKYGIIGHAGIQTRSNLSFFSSSSNRERISGSKKYMWSGEKAGNTRENA